MRLSRIPSSPRQPTTAESAIVPWVCKSGGQLKEEQEEQEEQVEVCIKVQKGRQGSDAGWWFIVLQQANT